MKTIFLLSFALLLATLPEAYSQQLPSTAGSCAAGDCNCIRDKALDAIHAGQHERAINKLQAWGICDPKYAKQADSLILEVFRRIEHEKRAALANDLANKSETALRDGDRTTAFRLAEFAHRYVDDENDKVLYALAGALYYNDHPDSTHRLPWNYNLEGHNGPVLCLAYSPDGKRLVTGSVDQTVKVWDMESGKSVYTFNGHFGAVNTVAFATNIPISGSSDGNTVKFWDIKNGTELESLVDTAVNNVAISQDSSKLAISYKDTIKIWDFGSGGEYFLLPRKQVLSLSFSPDGNWLATGSADSTAQIWSYRGGNAILTFKDHNGAVMSVAFSPDGYAPPSWGSYSKPSIQMPKQVDRMQSEYSTRPMQVWLATGSVDKTAKIWDLRTGKLAFTLEGHSDTIRSVAFSQDGKWLATGSADKTAKIWDLNTHKPILTLKGHSAAVNCIAFSPQDPNRSKGGQILATGSDDNTVKIWDLGIGETPSTIDSDSSDSNKVAFSRDSDKIVTGSVDNTIKLWYSGVRNKSFIVGGDSNNYYKLALSSDGNKLATASTDNIVNVWDLNSGELVFTTVEAMDGVSAMAFSPDGKNLAIGLTDSVKILELKSKNSPIILRRGEEYTGYGYSISTVAFSPDGEKLVIASNDGFIETWDLKKENAHRILHEQFYGIKSIDFSPDGKRFAIGLQDNSSEILNWDSGNVMQTLEGHEGALYSVAFSPDGKKLATGSGDYTAKIWDLGSGKTILTLTGHTEPIYCVAFSPDGNKLVTGSEDHTAKIWDLKSGKSVMTLHAHMSPVMNVTFSHDGKRLITTSIDQATKVWTLDANDIILGLNKERRLSTLNLAQLKYWDLEGLLDVQDRNEACLRQTNEAWQIAAFADLYAGRAAGRDDLRLSGPEYAHAARLYEFASQSMGKQARESNFSEKQSRLYRDWSFKLLTSGDPDSAFVLAERSLKLSPGDLESRKMVALTQLAKSSQDKRYFDSALASLLYMAESSYEFESLLDEFRKLKNQRTILPKTEETVRFLMFDQVDSLSAQKYGIRLPPYSTSEFELLKGLHDTIALLYHARKLHFSQNYINDIQAKADSLKEASALYLLLKERTGNPVYLHAHIDALNQAAQNLSYSYSRYDLTPELREKMIKEAGVLFKRIEADTGPFPEEQEYITQGIARCYYYLGNLLMEEKDYREATESYRQFSDVSTRLMKTYEKKKDNYSIGWVGFSRGTLAWSLLFNRQKDEALRIAKEATEYDGTGARVEAYLAHAQLCNGMEKEARRHYLSAVIKNDYRVNANILTDELVRLDSIYPGIASNMLPLLQGGEDTLLAEAERAGIPGASESIRDRRIQSALNNCMYLESRIYALNQGTDYRDIADTALLYVTACRELFAVDTSIGNKYQLGRALGNFSFYTCFTSKPERAIPAALEAFSILHEYWVRTNLAHGYLLSGDWTRAQAEYASIKDLPDDSNGEDVKMSVALWDDLQAFAKAGIRNKKLTAAGELVLGRPLTTEERAVLEGK